MRRFFERDTSEAQKQIEELREQLDKATTTIRLTEAEIAKSFTPDGAITREGLQIELTRLDRERTAIHKPEDTVAQSAINGRQKEILDLLRIDRKSVV